MNELEEVRELLTDLGIEKADFEINTKLTRIDVKALLDKSTLHHITHKSIQREFNRISATIEDFVILNESDDVYALFTVFLYNGMD